MFQIGIFYSVCNFFNVLSSISQAVNFLLSFLVIIIIIWNIITFEFYCPYFIFYCFYLLNIVFFGIHFLSQFDILYCFHGIIEIFALIGILNSSEMNNILCYIDGWNCLVLLFRKRLCFHHLTYLSCSYLISVFNNNV